MRKIASVIISLGLIFSYSGSQALAAEKKSTAKKKSTSKVKKASPSSKPKSASPQPSATASSEPNTPVKLTLLHNNDGESSLLADSLYKVETQTLVAGGAAAFATVFDREIKEARTRGNAVLSVYAGDSFLASKNIICNIWIFNKVPFISIYLNAGITVSKSRIIYGNWSQDNSCAFWNSSLDTILMN